MQDKDVDDTDKEQQDKYDYRGNQEESLRFHNRHDKIGDIQILGQRDCHAEAQYRRKQTEVEDNQQSPGTDQLFDRQNALFDAEQYRRLLTA